MWRLCLLALPFLSATAGAASAEEPVRPTALRFEVSLAEELVKTPQTGRLLVVLGRGATGEPRFSIGNTGLQVPPVMGRDVIGLAPGQIAALDRSNVIFPIPSLDNLVPGDYSLQAVLDTNLDLKSPNSPGNLYSEITKTRLDPAQPTTVKLQLSRQVPAEKAPADSARIKYVKLHSELLSKFHGRPIYLRAGVVLPPDYDKEPGRRYPLRVHIGGYGSRFTGAQRFARRGGGSPMLVLHLDGSGPFGDPYQVNSANNGPFGDAVTQELIPHVEKQFRGIGQPYARVLDGASTGGWVSLALQIFYPDFFNGAWSHCPDPVDFRAFELINIYRDDNAYVNRHGFERPAMRELNGDVRYTVRHETQIENVLGRGDSWTTSGKDWCAWNATFGPRGEDGRPKPLWDPQTGRIDHAVTPHWERYDLRLVLERNWQTLGPKLRGKLHVWVGEADDYFLNNAVHHLDRFLASAQPPPGGKVGFVPGAGHSFQGISESAMIEEMLAAIEAGKK